MAKCFVVVEDNAEEYEDYREYIMAVAMTRDDAVAYIESHGWEKEEDKEYWVKPADSWHMNLDYTCWIEEHRLIEKEE